MINLFRNNLLINSLLMLVYAAVLRIKEFYVPEHSEMTGGLFYNRIIQIITHPILESVLAIILIFIQAWMINHLVIKNKLGREITLLPGVFYIILMSLLPEFLGFSPILLANTFLILAYEELCIIYRKPKSAVHLFNAGFYLCIASLIYFPFVVFFFVGILSIIILNSVSFKFILQYLTGFIVPFFLTYTFLLIGDQSAAIWEGINGISIADKFTIKSNYHLYTLLISGVVLLIGIFSYNSFMIKKSIQAQKKIDILFWMLLFCGLSFFFLKTGQLYQLQILAFPLGVILHMSFLKIKNPKMAELVHLIMLATLFTLHFSLHLQF